MKRLRGAELKQYFRDPRRVTAWWRPKEGRYWFWHEQEFRIIDRYLQVNPLWKVLDAACGQGRFARYFAKKGCRVRGLDINVAMLGIARAEARCEGVSGNIEFVEGDIETFSRNNVGFDVVLCMDALDHMGDLNLAVKRLADSVKPGGIFIGTYTSAHSFYGFLRGVYTFFAYRWRSAEVDIARTYSLTEVRGSLVAAGVRIEHIFGIGLFMAPQERIRFPLLLNRVFEALSRLDIFVKPYYVDSWFAAHCSGVMFIGRRMA